MVSIPQSPYSFSSTTIKTGISSKPSLFSTVKLNIKPPKTLKLSSLSDSNSEPFLSKPHDDSSPENPQAEPVISDPVKRAFEKAKAYKKSKQVISSPVLVPVLESPGVDNESVNENALVSEVVESGASDVPDALKLAMEKAKDYKKKKGTAVSEKNEMEMDDMKDEIVEDRTREKGGSSISKIDFLGFDFSDKKSNRGIPPGLVPIVDPIVDGDMPEVELIVGDTSRFGVVQPPKLVNEDDNVDLYMPKVSTWGVFPRPGNISKTFGGGKIIRPGEVLETAEDKAAKQARTKQLIASYKSKMGLNIDAKVKAECEKALKDGDSLMDRGKLQEALPYYERVMKAVVFQSELHGLAALQWSICQDSLSRPDEARVMYEKLQSHPNSQVSKKARQFMFSFQAMDKMKVTRSSYKSKATGYQGYFEAFIKDSDRTNYVVEKEKEDEGALRQVLPYILFLFSPLFIMLIIAVKRGV
ncbi:uncharacterized protein [Aristolochia californica]|uniref:uncharacterized protein isoform X2 n=1 Tax=Aristolochia californica TaxID=171875 RepID=UPI0035DAED56